MAADAALTAAAPGGCTPTPSFIGALALLMRAHDTYGVWERKSDEEILQAFVLTREQRRAIPVIGEPDSKVLWRLELVYTAVSYVITRRSGRDATPIVKVSGEGFGRALVTVGRLVVLSRVLRDVHRFGFESVSALAAAGEAMVAESLEIMARFPAVAGEAA